MIPKIIFNREKKDWIKRPLLSNIEKILDYRGRTPKKLGLSWSDTGFLALSALNVKNGYIDFNVDANYGDQELYDRWMGDNHLHKGQVVFTTEAPMGNVAQIPNDDLYILSQRTIAFEVKHHLIKEDFLATLLRSPKIFNELTSLSSGGTAKGVSQKSLSNLKVCIPTSLEERSAIGSLFRNLDDLLASYKDNLANYQSLKATMLSKMFPKAGQTVPEIRLVGFKDEWEEGTIGEFGSFYYGKSAPKWSVTDEATTPCVRYGELYTKFSTKIDKIYSYTSIPKENLKLSSGNEVLVPRVGENPLDFANCSWLSLKGVAIGEMISVYNTPNNPLFIAYYFNAKMKKEFAKRVEGGSVANLYYTYLENISISVPSLPEQKAIGAYFSNLDNLINSHQEKISQLETLKKKLLQDMFI